MHKTEKRRELNGEQKWKKKSQFDNALKIIWHFDCADNIFDYCLYREKG